MYAELGFRTVFHSLSMNGHTSDQGLSPPDTLVVHRVSSDPLLARPTKTHSRGSYGK